MAAPQALHITATTPWQDSATYLHNSSISSLTLPLLLCSTRHNIKAPSRDPILSHSYTKNNAMIVPFPISFTFNFSVGVKYVLVEMRLVTGDDSQEVVMQFIQTENIPIYLETNLLSAVETFLHDAIQFEKDEEDEQCGMPLRSSFSPLLTLSYEC